VEFVDFDQFLRLLEDSRVSKQVVRAKDLLLECANDFGIANVDRAALEELGHEQKGCEPLIYLNFLTTIFHLPMW